MGDSFITSGSTTLPASPTAPINPCPSLGWSETAGARASLWAAKPGRSPLPDDQAPVQKSTSADTKNPKIHEHPRVIQRALHAGQTGLLPQQRRISAKTLVLIGRKIGLNKWRPPQTVLRRFATKLLTAASI